MGDPILLVLFLCAVALVAALVWPSGGTAQPAQEWSEDEGLPTGEGGQE